jgi:hypothetical protein
MSFLIYLTPPPPPPSQIKPSSRESKVHSELWPPPLARVCHSLVSTNRRKKRAVYVVSPSQTKYCHHFICQPERVCTVIFFGAEIQPKHLVFCYLGFLPGFSLVFCCLPHPMHTLHSRFQENQAFLF